MSGIDTEENTSGEAHAYTPGLKVKRSTVVQKLRRLPILGEVLVNVGDTVEYDACVAITNIRGDPTIVKAALLLGVEPEDLQQYLNKNVGDPVKKGDSLASYSAFFGLVKKQVDAPINGVLESISNVTGQLIIRGDPIPVEVDCYIPGKIIEVVPKEGAVVETNAAFIQGIIGIGGETHGAIRIAVDSPEEELTADKITPEDKENVIVGGSLVTIDAIRKGVEVGASCIVSGGIRHDVLKEFMGEEIGVAITGQEELGITLIVTEGFGKMRMSQRTFDLLKDFEGYRAAVNGATQIRAGVLRPEIIIPHEQAVEASDEDSLAAGMTKGTPVRIIRQPYFGSIAAVVSLPIELQQVHSESMVRVVNLELDDGSIVTVPRANVEIIEE